MTPGEQREEWRRVPEWADLYEVSSLGRVRNAKTGRIKTEQVDRTGRRWVALQRGGNEKMQTARVHRLVALAFLGSPMAGQTDVCHNDGNPANNRASNLRWDTHAANMADVIRHGTGRSGNSGKASCKWGHPFTPDNTYVAPSGARHCRTCRQRHQRAYENRRRAL